MLKGTPMKVAMKDTMLAPNEAAWRVGTWLSRSCLVRPVAADTDIGIDLYCELIQKERPFLHFWVQVKTGATQITFEKDSQTARFTFRAKDLDYWWRQPIPVFVFLVPPRGHASERWLYIVDVTRWLVQRGGPPGTAMQIVSQHRCEFQGESDLRKFLDDTVPKTYAMLAIREGVSRHVPQLDPAYEVVTMYQYRAMFHQEVVEQIRQTASGTLTDLMMAGSLTLLTSAQIASASHLAKLLEVYTKLPFTKYHHEDFRALGLFAQWEGDGQQAKALYRRAQESIRNDPVIDPKDAAWMASLDAYDRLIASCEKQ